MKLSIVVEFDHCPMEHGDQAGFWLAIFAQESAHNEHVEFHITRPTKRQVRKAVKAFYRGQHELHC